MSTLAERETRDTALLRAAACGDLRARETILVSRLPLVRRVAAHYRGAGLPFDDVVQEGSIGLLEAIDGFDPTLHVPFDSYARFRIHRAIRNALTERSRLVRLPKYVVERRRTLERESARAFAASGHAPTAAELASRTGLPVEAVLSALDAAIDAISLDEPVLPDGSPLEAMVADPSAADPERVVVHEDELRLVDAAVEHLPARQRRVVRETFGIGTPAEPISAVAAELHISAQRTRTIALDALRKLRDELEAADSGVSTQRRRAPADR